MAGAEKLNKQKKAFCVSLSANGATTKFESDDISEIVKLLKEDALQSF